MKKAGSAIILVLVIAAAITILMTTIMKTIVTFHTLALERKEYVYQRQALEAVTYYGIAIAKKQWQEKNEKEYHRSFAIWPPPKSSYQANVRIVPIQNGCTVTAQLIQQQNTLCALECSILKENDHWYIVQWDFK